MNNPRQISYSPSYDVVVTGTDPECADMSNPHGHTFGDAYYMVATDASGFRKTLFLGVNYDNHAGQRGAQGKADKLAAALNARAATGRFPVRWADWRESRPMYGSDAFIESDQGAEDAALERADALGY